MNSRVGYVLGAILIITMTAGCRVGNYVYLKREKQLPLLNISDALNFNREESKEFKAFKSSRLFRDSKTTKTPGKAFYSFFIF